MKLNQRDLIFNCFIHFDFQIKSHSYLHHYENLLQLKEDLIKKHSNLEDFAAPLRALGRDDQKILNLFEIRNQASRTPQDPLTLIFRRFA